MPGGKGKDPSKARARVQLLGASNSKSPAGQNAPLPEISPVEEVKGPNVEELFTTMEAQIKAEDFEKVVATADEILAVLPGDPSALECKVAALIQADRFSDCLDIINAGAPPGVDFSFQKAYSLYRLNRHTEALSILSTMEKTPAVLHLEAQSLYRTGDSAGTIRRYEQLLGGPSAREVGDGVKMNLMAAYVAGGRGGEVKGLAEKLQVSPSNVFEVAYNVACGMIEIGQFKEAEEMLLLATRVGKEALLEDDYPEDEIASELAPITTQLHFVQQMLGRTSEAIEGYMAVFRHKIPDSSSSAVAVCNLIAARGAKELLDGLKRVEKAVGGKGEEVRGGGRLEWKLARRQKEGMMRNTALLLMHAKKMEQAREILPIVAQFCVDTCTPALLEASLAVKEGNLGQANEILGQAAESFGSEEGWDLADVRLMRAQVAATSGNYREAADSLEEIEGLKNRPAVVATTVDARVRAGDLAGAESALDSAVHYWDHRMEEDAPTTRPPTPHPQQGAPPPPPSAPSPLEVMVLHAAEFKRGSGKEEEAVRLYQRLLLSGNARRRAEGVNGTLTCLVAMDLAKAEAYEGDLPPLPGTATLDGFQLEQNASAPSVSTTRGKRALGGEEGGEVARARKKRKKKKVIWPKNYDPANPPPPPDPERWLPKRERSSFKPKRKDKRAAANAQIRGTQGAVAKEKPGGEGGGGGAKGVGRGGGGGPPNVSAAAVKPEKSVEGGGGASGVKGKKGKKGRR